MLISKKIQKVIIMANDLLSKKYYEKFKNNTREEFSGYLQEIILDFEEDYYVGLSSPHFLKEMKEILSEINIEYFSPFSFYWANLLENYLELIEAHEEEDSDYIFYFWETGPFSEIFLEKVKESEDTLKVSQSLLSILEENIISFFYIHLSSKDKKFEHPHFYSLLPEIGDFNGKIHINQNKDYVSCTLPKNESTSVGLLSIDNQRKFFDFVIKEKVESFCPSPSNSYLVEIEDLKLNMYPSENTPDAEMSKWVAQSKKALLIIKDISPSLFSLFKEFTHSIIPINEKGIVSYSMQELPSFSSLNYIERDFIDHMDDLLHENGHHYLNMILNQEDLIIEDDEKIYYSPWRQALRPIRGIYHATFTFFWALKLFNDFIEYIEKNPSQILFSTEDQIKIYSRFLEEYTMLTYCYLDLLHAYEVGKILPEGMSLISKIYELISQMEDSFDQRKDKLKTLSLKEFSEFEGLHQLLKEKRSHFSHS